MTVRSTTTMLVAAGVLAVGAVSTLASGSVARAASHDHAAPARQAGAHSGTAHLTTARSATVTGTNRIRFSRMVVVDQQRPGNEPDVKTNSRGTIFTSVPFGFSTTSSFMWRSLDHGKSYQLVPGNIGTGKPETCAGGGDTDLFIDPHNALYFSDLQGLTNISNSVSTDGGKTWNTNCAGAPNTPDDRMWFAGKGSLAKNNLHLYQDYDAVESAADPNNPGGNQLVETLSTDGTHFVPVVNSNPSAECLGFGAANCVTDNEGISGNQVVDPKTGNVFIAHTSLNGNQQGGTPGVEVSEGAVDTSTPVPTAKWTESPNLDGALCRATPKHSCVDKNGNPTELAGENFASIARDRAGYLYVTFTAGPIDHKSTSDANFGQLTKPEQIYVVHSLQPATMKDPSKLTWSAPERITGPHRGISAGTNTFPWITAGSRGRVAVAYYHTRLTRQKGPVFGASNLTHAEWTVQVAETLHGAAKAPSYRHATVSDGSVKYGQICTSGIGCATGGDRSLGDFLQVSPARNGAMLVTYVDDTSGNVQAGEDTGPEVISRQIHGPGLFAGRRVTVDGGPGRASGHVRDRRGDAFYSANGTRTSADKNGAPQLDLRGASIRQPRHRGYLVARLRVRNLKSITGNAALGGPDASWLLRWTVLHPHKPGNGLIGYAGMDNSGGSTPTFFMGRTSCIPANNQAEHCKFLTYPQNRKIKGHLDAKHNVIRLYIPKKALGLQHVRRLISVTGFTATSATPQSASTIFNLIDATAPFDVHVHKH